MKRPSRLAAPRMNTAALSRIQVCKDVFLTLCSHRVIIHLFPLGPITN